MRLLFPQTSSPGLGLADVALWLKWVRVWRVLGRRFWTPPLKFCVSSQLPTLARKRLEPEAQDLRILEQEKKTIAIPHDTTGALRPRKGEKFA